MERKKERKSLTFYLHDGILALLGGILVLSLESCLSDLILGIDPFQLGFGVWTYLGLAIVSFGLMQGLVRYGNPYWREWDED
ncbi:hypothetical protein [Paludifilum halophilum]|uniref:Uncharacterized protein n=1 Tax=Paludifilum halophilum TaxID=1642702 RepID=A0A235B9G5_9BACL|nr:hypothetical protein [Paludifilum halophilum]OYD08934.1 hypothetical protein CHM34_03915 [Paludifilum halophilum]